MVKKSKTNKSKKDKKDKISGQIHPQETEFQKIRDYFKLVNSTISEIIYNILLEIPRDRLLTNDDIVQIIKKIKSNPKLKNVNVVLLLKYFQSFGRDLFDDIFNKFYLHVCSGGFDTINKTGTEHDILKYVMCLNEGDKTFNTSIDNIDNKFYYSLIHNIHIYYNQEFIETFNNVYDKIIQLQEIPNNVVISLGDSLSKIVDGINFSNYTTSGKNNNKFIDTLFISGNITEYYKAIDGGEYLKLSEDKVKALNVKAEFMREYLFKNIIETIGSGKTITFIDYGYSGRALVTLDYIFTKILFPKNPKMKDKINFVNFTNKGDDITNLLNRLRKDINLKADEKYTMSLKYELVPTPIQTQIIDSEDYEARCIPQFPVNDWSIKKYQEYLKNPIFTNDFNAYDYVLKVARDLNDPRFKEDETDVKQKKKRYGEYKTYFGCNLNRLFCNIMVLFHISDSEKYKLENPELIQNMGIEEDIRESKKYQSEDIKLIETILWDILMSDYSNFEKYDKSIIPDEILQKINSFLKLNPSENAFEDIMYKLKYLKYKLKYLKLKKMNK